MFTGLDLRWEDDVFNSTRFGFYFGVVFPARRLGFSIRKICRGCGLECSLSGFSIISQFIFV